VTESHVDWTFTGSVSSTPSAVEADGLFYFIADKTGVASCLDLESGNLVWQHRIGGSFSASPILSGERVYFFDRDGRTTVLAHGRKPRLLSVNELEAGCMASPAASEGALYLRSTTHLYRIEARGH
jgi:outer membrane protein assembly factor BamB